MKLKEEPCMFRSRYRLVHLHLWSFLLNDISVSHNQVRNHYGDLPVLLDFASLKYAVS